MTTATATYTVKYNADEQGWDVLDADGEQYDHYATRAEAHAEAKRLNDAEEVERLYDAISDRISEAETDGDLDTLRKVAAMLGL